MNCCGWALNPLEDIFSEESEICAGSIRKNYDCIQCIQNHKCFSMALTMDAHIIGVQLVWASQSQRRMHEEKSNQTIKWGSRLQNLWLRSLQFACD